MKVGASDNGKTFRRGTIGEHAGPGEARFVLDKSTKDSFGALRVV